MSFGVTELIIIAVIVLLLFGTTKLKSLGSDLGSAIKGFKSAMDEDEQPKLKADAPTSIPEATSTSEAQKSEAKKES